MFIDPHEVRKWIDAKVPEELISANGIDIPLKQLFRVGGAINTLIISKRTGSIRPDLIEEQPLRMSLVPYSSLHADVGDHTIMFNLQAGTQYQFLSRWKIRMPAGIVGWLIHRSTLNRSGITVFSGLYDSGYNGPIGGTIYTHNINAYVEHGTAVAQLVCARADGNALYDGQYQER